MIKQNRTIRIDLDDVMSDMLGLWLLFYNDKYEDTVKPSDIKGWEISEYLPKCTATQAMEIIDLANFFRNVPPKPRAKLVIKRLRERGDRVVCCSAYTNARQLADKEYWLKTFMGIERANTIFTTAKELVIADIAIDDNINNLIGFKGVRVLFTAPHNLTVTEGFDYRVNDWFELETLLMSE